jgi:hypothetical protein
MSEYKETRHHGKHTMVFLISRFQFHSVVLTWYLFVCFWRNSPQSALASSFTKFLDHTQRRATVDRTPLDEWSARCRDSTWQHTTLTTDRHPCPHGIRKHNFSRRAAADLRLRPHGHWDRLVSLARFFFYEYTLTYIGVEFLTWNARSLLLILNPYPHLLWHFNDRHPYHSDKFCSNIVPNFQFTFDILLHIKRLNLIKSVLWRVNEISWIILPSCGRAS